MKQIITLLVCAALFTACKTATEKPISSDAKMMTVSDAADYAEFTAWKQQKAEAEMKALAAKESRPTVIYVNQPAPARTRTVVRQPRAEYPVISQTPGSTTQPVAQKKRWSKAAKGAVIGAGAGAVAGAVIAKKNRVLGAVIGGVAGGGVGYGIGRGMDKRDGRY
jgi:hypothetical protein